MCVRRTPNLRSIQSLWFRLLICPKVWHLCGRIRTTVARVSLLQSLIRMRNSSHSHRPTHTEQEYCVRTENSRRKIIKNYFFLFFNIRLPFNQFHLHISEKLISLFSSAQCTHGVDGSLWIRSICSTSLYVSHTSIRLVFRNEPFSNLNIHIYLYLYFIVDKCMNNIECRFGNDDVVQIEKTFL